MSRREEQEKRREREERDHQLKTPPELAALEAELASLRPAAASFDAETVFDRASSRRIAREVRPTPVVRLAWLATGFIAGAVLVAAGFAIWRPTREVEIVRVETVYVAATPSVPVEEGPAAHSVPPVLTIETVEAASDVQESPILPASRYAVLARGNIDLERLDEYLERMSALANRMESAADQWRCSRSYYWSRTARDSPRESEAKSWNRYRALIDSAGAGELLSL